MSDTNHGGFEAVTSHLNASSSSVSTTSMSTSPAIKGKSRARLELLDLPDEILALIVSHLDLPTLLPFLSLNPILLSLTQSHLSPLPHCIRRILLTKPSLPHQHPHLTHLAVLPTLRSYLPKHDPPGDLFLEVLIRGEPRWILERMEFGQRWPQSLWRRAFEGRFLRSWRRYMVEGDNWRAVFLRTLRRLEHRHLGCTHEESWTRFITIHRNGSASINRIYSHSFDPYEIYDELKNQNNFASQPTTVRVLLQLQDVRILAIGVLLSQPSLFVNPNAHLLLHPPLLRGIHPVDHLASANVLNTEHDHTPKATSVSNPVPTGSGLRPITIRSPSSTATNEAYFPLVRSLSPSTSQTTSYGLSPPASPFPTTAMGLVTPSSPSLRSALSSLIPRRRALSSGHTHNQAHSSSSQAGSQTENESSRLGGLLVHVHSRDSEENRRRSWAFGRTRSGSIIPSASSSAGIPDGTQTIGNHMLTDTQDGLERINTRLTDAPETPLPTLEEDRTPPVDFRSTRQSQIRISDSRSPSHVRNPYTPLKTPLPTPNFRKYPNYTFPPSSISSEANSNSSTESIENHLDGNGAENDVPSLSLDPEKYGDKRYLYHEVEDDGDGMIWANEAVWRMKSNASTMATSHDGVEMEEGVEVARMAEWDERNQCRRRWVGPMILVAQLSANRTLDPTQTSMEGENVDLGSAGMYASLELDDLQDIASWVQFRGGGGGGRMAFRNGLGFE